MYKPLTKEKARYYSELCQQCAIDEAIEKQYLLPLTTDRCEKIGLNK